MRRGGAPCDDGHRGHDHVLEQHDLFRGGLVFEAHRLVYHSALGSRVIKKNRRQHDLQRVLSLQGLVKLTSSVKLIGSVQLTVCTCAVLSVVWRGLVLCIWFDLVSICTCISIQSCRVYRGTSLIRNRTTLGPCSRPMPRVLWRSQGGRLFLMSEVPL